MENIFVVSFVTTQFHVLLEILVLLVSTLFCQSRIVVADYLVYYTDQSFFQLLVLVS